MYNTDEEFDVELEELRKKIAEEAALAETEEVSSAEEVDNITEPSDNDKILEAIKSLFDENITADEIIKTVTESVNTACKRFKADYDVDTLIQQEKTVKEVYPEFDLVAELSGNVLFKRLIANGVKVDSALLASNKNYQDFITDKIKCDAKREMADALRRGKERIMPQIEKKSADPEYDLTKVSDEEFEAIENKVKQNKRVFL